MKRAYIDTNVFQIINPRKDLNVNNKEELNDIRIIFELFPKSLLPIIGPVVFKEIDQRKGADFRKESPKSDLTAMVYRVSGEVSQYLDQDEGSVVYGKYLRVFESVGDLSSISKPDREILADAIMYECNFIITCDHDFQTGMQSLPGKYRNHMPRVLSPSEFVVQKGSKSLELTRDIEGSRTGMESVGFSRIVRTRTGSVAAPSLMRSTADAQSTAERGYCSRVHR
jgi:hypothetical protein